MSLIQDALRRQQEEFEDGVTRKTPTTISEPPVTETMPVMGRPAPTASTPVTAPTPVPPPPPPRYLKASKAWLSMAGIGGIIVIALVAGGIVVKWTLLTVRKNMDMVQRVSRQVPSGSQPQGPQAGEVPQVATPVSGKATEPVAGVEPVPSKSKAPSAPAAVPDTAAPQGAVSPVPVAAASPEFQVAPMGSEVPGKAVTVPPPLQWPVLKLTGVLSSWGVGEGAARINNQMVFVGGQIEGVTLIEVRQDGVLLKYGEETKFLKMGGVLY